MAVNGSFKFYFKLFEEIRHLPDNTLLRMQPHPRPWRLLVKLVHEFNPRKPRLRVRVVHDLNPRQAEGCIVEHGKRHSWPVAWALGNAGIAALTHDLRGSESVQTNCSGEPEPVSRKI